MNVSRLITGIILLVAAALLAVLAFVLPPENMMFMIGNANVPFVPAIVLGIVGIWLVVTAGGVRKWLRRTRCWKNQPLRRTRRRWR